MNQTLAAMKALADRNRLRITMALRGVDELCACQITELLAVSGATISNHLNILNRAKIVQSRREGKFIFYRLRQDSGYEELLDWLLKRLGTTSEIQSDYLSLRQILACGPEEICRRQRGEKCCPSLPSPRE